MIFSEKIKIMILILISNKLINLISLKNNIKFILST